MYPLTFPYEILSTANRNEWVLDPFCGRGTTLFAARIKSCNSVGIDSNQVACAISKAKLVSTTANEVTRLCGHILGSKLSFDIPEGEFWEHCYSSSTLKQICKIREYLLNSCETDAEIALRAIMLGILHGPRNVNTISYLSNQMPRTFSTKPKYSVNYWHKKGLEPPKIDVKEVVKRRAEFVFKTLPDRTNGFIIDQDSRKTFQVEAGVKFSWVITSPPYLGMVTYKQDQWLRNWFVGGPWKVDYTKPNQISHISLNDFEDDLKKVWKNVADVCTKRAKLVIRLGVLPSFKGTAREILESTLEADWDIQAIISAGMPGRGNRQAEHFGTSIGKANQELDCFAVLK
jgi:hypothetical protein